VANLAYLGPHDYSEDQLLARLEETPPIIAVDTETVSLKDRRCIGIGFALSADEAVYFPTMPVPSKHLRLAWKLLASPALKIFHNALYDLTSILEHYRGGTAPAAPGLVEFVGPTFVGPKRRPLIADTATMGHVQGLPSVVLQDMASTYISYSIQSIPDILPKGCTMLDIPQSVTALKCMKDCLATYRLYHQMGADAWWSADSHTWRYAPNTLSGYDPGAPTSHTVTQAMNDCYQVDIRIMPLLMRMSQRGIKLRPQLLKDWYKKLSERQVFYAGVCEKEGFNPGSPQQVGFILANRGSFLPFTKSKRQLQTGNDVLQGLDDPMAIIVLQHRSVTKLKSNYVVPWLGLDEDGIAHPHDRAYTHLYLDTSTGRLKSSDRNLQNIPAIMREIFAPDTGTWSSLDDTQIEMRMLAHLSGDPVMLKAYEEGNDIHAATQMRLWPNTSLDDKEARRRVKVFNFEMTFGGGARALAASTGLPPAVCKAYVAEWLALYEVLAEWLEAQAREAPYIGYVETVFGRKCRLPGMDRATIGHIGRCGRNYGAQGSAADAVKRQMLLCDEFGMDEALQIHDEILIDGDVDFPPELAHVHPSIAVPFKTYQSATWL